MIALDQAVDSKSENNMGKALWRFTREDPTFRAGIDEESGETIIRGWASCTSRSTSSA